MIALYQPIEHFTRAGWFALARRHGDVARLRSFARARERRAIDAGTEAPIGNAMVRPVGASPWRYFDGPTVADVMAAVGTIPYGDRARAEVCSVRVGRRSWMEVGVPVADDLDAAGVCRCGCGWGR